MSILGFLIAGLLASHVKALQWHFADADSFKEALSDGEKMLVAFVAPEDELSKPFLPEWSKLQKQFAFAKILNCTDIPKTCLAADVSSFPTIRLYQADGGMVRYRGPRKASSIMGFVERMARPVVTNLTPETLRSFSKLDEIVVLAHLREEDQHFRSHFLDVANTFRDRYTFGAANLPSKSPVSEVICRNNLDDMEHRIIDLDRVDSLERLIEKCVSPLILPLTRRNEAVFNRIAKSPVYYFSDYEPDIHAYTDMMRPIAKMFSEFLIFATVDSTEYPDMPQTFGLANGRGLCLQTLNNGEIFHYEDTEVSAQGLQQFIMAVSDGNIQPWNRGGGGSQTHDEL